MDNTLVAHDSGRGPYPNRDISEDEIRLRLQRLGDRTRYTTLIFDCCHSATAHRDLFGDADRYVDDDLRPPGELPPLSLPETLDRGAGLAGEILFVPKSDRFVAIAACRDIETAKEHTVQEGGQVVRHGALSYFLTREIISRAGPGTTYRDVFERAAAQVTAFYATQHPHCEGARDRALFGVTDIRPMRFVPVSRVAAGSVTLAAGVAHGVAAGSQWDLYPPGTKEAGAAALAQVEVTRATALSAEARIVSSGRSLQPPLRAVERSRPQGGQLLVDLWGAEAPALAALRQRIASSPWLRPAGPGIEPDLRVYLVPPRDRAADPVPQLGIQKEATWAVVGRDGQLLMRPRPAAGPEEAEALFYNLEMLSRFAQTLRLAAPQSPLAGKVEIKLFRKRPGASYEELAGASVFDEGDQVAIEVWNRHGSPVYVTILAFGIDKSIIQLHPPEGVPGEPIDPGRCLRIGDASLYFPENQSLLASAEGHDYLKFFITSQPVDFSPLLAAGLRAVEVPRTRGDETALGQLMASVFSGAGRRNFSVKPAEPEVWAEETRQIVLRRRAVPK
jgi:hypothetical protein